MPRPILLLIFNRPMETRQVVETLKTWPGTHIYIAGDGPRAHSAQDDDSCERARGIALELSSHHKVSTRFLDSNLGAARGVASAIDWFFEHEEAGIILEDDCVPLGCFNSFADELLSRYQQDSQVMMISGNNFFWHRSITSNEYYFSRHGHIWGWATWRRAWNLFDFTMSDWSAVRDTDWLRETCRGHLDSTRYWSNIFDRTSQESIDAWDFRWVWSMWRHSGLSISPARNLVKNIGFSRTATHTSRPPWWLKRIETTEVTFPLRHPEQITPDLASERFADLNIFGVSRSPLQRLRRFLVS